VLELGLDGAKVRVRMAGSASTLGCLVKGGPSSNGAAGSKNRAGARLRGDRGHPIDLLREEAGNRRHESR
jgi:hypothetical protein